MMKNTPSILKLSRLVIVLLCSSLLDRNLTLFSQLQGPTYSCICLIHGFNIPNHNRNMSSLKLGAALEGFKYNL